MLLIWVRINNTNFGLITETASSALSQQQWQDVKKRKRWFCSFCSHSQQQLDLWLTKKILIGVENRTCLTGRPSSDLKLQTSSEYNNMFLVPTPRHAVCLCLWDDMLVSALLRLWVSGSFVFLLLTTAGSDFNGHRNHLQSQPIPIFTRGQTGLHHGHIRNPHAGRNTCVSFTNDDVSVFNGTRH